MLRVGIRHKQGLLVWVWQELWVCVGGSSPVGAAVVAQAVSAWLCWLGRWVPLPGSSVWGRWAPQWREVGTVWWLLLHQLLLYPIPFLWYQQGTEHACDRNYFGLEFLRPQNSNFLSQFLLCFKSVTQSRIAHAVFFTGAVIMFKSLCNELRAMIS